MKLQPGWTFLGILKNIFFTLLFIQMLPFLISGVKNTLATIDCKYVEVGYVTLRGMISDSASFVKQLEEFEKNPLIKGVMIKVDSPGGMPASSQAMLQAVLHCKEKKPVVAFTENLCASGSYYAVCGATKVFANPSSLVGSIGAVMSVQNVKGLLESWKIKSTCIKAGEYKTALDPFQEIKQGDITYMQVLADETYNQFVEDVAKHRGIDKKQQKLWANGKIFTGNQALQLKLIDELGSSRAAVDYMKKLLEVSADTNLKFITSSHASKGLMQRLLHGDDDEDGDMSTCVTASVADFITNVYQQVVMQVNNGKYQIVA